MRIAFGILLAVLGILIFPLGYLATRPGLMFGGFSVALWIIAFRLLRMKSQNQPTSAPAAPPSPSPIALDFPIAPSMPNIWGANAVSAYILGERIVRFFDRPQTVGQSAPGVTPPIQHLFAATVWDTAGPQLERVFCLEQGATGGVFLCTFERSGEHCNFGEGKMFTTLLTFESAVLDRVAAEQEGVDSASAMPCAT